jgi:Protein of unknown function (DUF1559)
MKTKIAIIVVGLLTLTLCLCTGTLGMLQFIVQTIWYLLTGWGYFIARNVQRAEPRADVVIAGLTALLLMAVVVHRLIRRVPTSAPSESDPPRRWSMRTSAAVVAVIVLLFVAGVSTIAITHQTLWMFTSDESTLRTARGIREASPQGYSKGYLKQMGEGTHNYVGEHEKCPLPATMTKDGRFLHSWQTQLLPYMEKFELHKQIDFSKPWNDPANRHLFRNEIKAYRHPSVMPTHDERGFAITSYSLNVHALPFDRQIRFDELPNGTSNTLLIGEAAGHFPPWGYPVNVRDPRLGLNRTTSGFGGPVRGITQFVMADGSVRAFTDDADPEFLKMIAEPGR